MKAISIKLTLIVSITFLICSCEKPMTCNCTRQFVAGEYYQPYEVVKNNGKCWMLNSCSGCPGGYIYANDEPTGSFPNTQDVWVELCEN